MPRSSTLVAAPKVREPGELSAAVHLLTADVFAAFCGVSTATFYRLVSARELPEADRRVGPAGGCVRWSRELAESSALLGAEAVAGMLCLGRSTLDDLVRAGDFPAPDSTHGCRRWRLSTVRRWAAGG